MESSSHSRLSSEMLCDRSLCRSCGVLLILPGLVVYGLASMMVEVCFPTLHAWPQRRRDRKKDAKMEKAFRNKFGDPGRLTADSKIEIPRLRPPMALADVVGSREGPPKYGFFRILPPEIRRQIMLEAFGDHIIYVDLEYRYPYLKSGRRDYCFQHAGYAQDSSQRGQFDRYAGAKKWRWWSSICHHYPSQSSLVWMSHGRRGLSADKSALSCIKGSSQCHLWHVTCPSKCHIGVMGWLLSCRQAYFETTEILYSANTFSIESPVLIRTFHSIISSQMRTQLSSLTFSWDLKKVSLGQSFKFQTLTVWSSSSTKPLFPSLRYLRLALDPFPRVTESIFAPPGFPNPPRVDKRMMRRRLYEEFYPGFEALLDMVAPVAAEVTLTLSDWDLYECIDLDLVNKQGREKTSLQRSEYGGLKCWKERVSRNGTTTGYWVHVGADHMRLDQTIRYDWKRHQMYNLGEDKYVCAGSKLWQDELVED